MSDGALATASVRLLPDVLDDETPVPAAVAKVNGKPSPQAIAEQMDLTRVSRSTVAALLREARRLARG